MILRGYNAVYRNAAQPCSLSAAVISNRHANRIPYPGKQDHSGAFGRHHQSAVSAAGQRGRLRAGVLGDGQLPRAGLQVRKNV